MAYDLGGPAPSALQSGDELIIDNFAGGGGASEGIRRALGRGPDIAVNHDGDALAMHEVNHPDTHHIHKNIWHVDPIDAVQGRPVGLLWMSPDCKHFSKSKGAKPVARNIRDLAWTGLVWAKRARPRVIILENVEEFRDWGPVKADGMPCPERRGQTFDQFVKELKRLGYKVEHRELRACDYGSPTVRKRLFMIARRDGAKIKWPEPTHGAPNDPAVIAGKKKPWRTAAEIIDWSLPCPSIFMTREEARAYHAATGIRVNRPLADTTMARVARGVFRFVIDAAEPFIVPLTHHGDLRVHSLRDPLPTQTAANRGEHAFVAPYLVPRYGEREGQEPRALPIGAPMPTIVPTGNEGTLIAPVLVGCGGRAGQSPPRTVRDPMNTATTKEDACVVAAFLAQHNTMPKGPPHPGTSAEAPVTTITHRGTQQSIVAASLVNMRGKDRGGWPITTPAPTITAGGKHVAEVRAFLVKYYGTAIGQDLRDPLHTVTTRDRIGLVMVHGEPYEIVDIGMRMLTPRERFRAQGFGDHYIIDRRPDGSPITATKQGACAGNSVCPDLAEALVRANCPDLIIEEREAA